MLNKHTYLGSKMCEAAFKCMMTKKSDIKLRPRSCEVTSLMTMLFPCNNYIASYIVITKNKFRVKKEVGTTVKKQGNK